MDRMGKIMNSFVLGISVLIGLNVLRYFNLENKNFFIGWLAVFVPTFVCYMVISFVFKQIAKLAKGNK